MCRAATELDECILHGQRSFCGTACGRNEALQVQISASLRGATALSLLEANCQGSFEAFVSMGSTPTRCRQCTSYTTAFTTRINSTCLYSLWFHRVLGTKIGRLCMCGSPVALLRDMRRAKTLSRARRSSISNTLRECRKVHPLESSYTCTTVVAVHTAVHTPPGSKFAEN